MAKVAAVVIVMMMMMMGMGDVSVKGDIAGCG